MEKFYTYIIESELNQRWYIGHTNDITRRLVEHNSGQNKYTKGKGLWRLIFLRSFDNNLKKLRNKKFIRNEYSEFFLND